MVAPIDHDDLGIAVSQGFCRTNPSEAASNDDDALLRSHLFRVRRVCDVLILHRICQRGAHGDALFASRERE